MLLQDALGIDERVGRRAVGPIDDRQDRTERAEELAQCGNPGRVGGP
jgi:hypothetical protein